MKVGIISMQRVVNYGSFLQAYSLKNIIEKLGNEVEFIDYKVEPPIVEKYISNEYSNCKETAAKTSLLKKAARFLWENKNAKSRKLRRYYRAKMYLTKRYNEEFLPMLGVTKQYRYNLCEDAIVIGSDEVFNCLQANKDVGYSKELFGYDANSKILISYAASFGTTTYEGLEKYGIAGEVADMLSEFDYISVRDKNSLSVVEKLIGDTPDYHVDPVLINDYDGLIPQSVALKNYMIVYAYGSRISDEEAMYINRFAGENNLKVITLGETNRFEWDHLIVNPFEVLAYFKNASYVVTDTFHGTVFSIKYSKQFATIIRDSNRQKLSDLLERFNLTNRQVNDIACLELVLKSKTDFDSAQKQIIKEKKNSIEYLKKYLGNGQVKE